MPSASTKYIVGRPADLGELVEALQVAARVGQRRVGHPALPGLLEGAAGVLVLEVDAEHRHPVAVLLVEGLQRRHLLACRARSRRARG